MKKILIIILAIFLTSCTKNLDILEPINIDNKVLIEASDEYQKNIFKSNSIKQKIIWDKNIRFTYCDNLSKYNNKEDYYQSEDFLLLKEKIKNKIYYTNYNIKYNFPKKINEFCKTNDSTKYILWWTTKYNTIIIWKYDKILDTFEVIDFKWNFNKYYMNKWWNISWRNYWDTSLEKYYYKYVESKKDITWFWIKNKNIIPFANYWVSITWSAESAPWIFSDILHLFSNKSREYCEWWLTPEWKLSVCFVDIFYDIDFVKNEIKDSRVCSYYVDDTWKVKILEKCFDFKENYKWYNLKYKAKWIDIYQDNSWNLSVLDIDLNSTNISFWWVNTTYKKFKWENLEWHVDEYWVVQIPDSYDVKSISKIEYENKNSKLYRFNRYKAKNFPSTIKLEYRKKYNTNAVINWQFFDQNKNPTFLSFPLKSWWKIINSHIDNDIPKRTFIIDVDWNTKIIEWYKKEYLKNKNYEELIVGFSPDVNSNKNSKIWRTYVWIKNSKNIVFFIAKNKTQKEMNKIISNYWIKKDNIIMMDWWPSSQFAYYENNWPWSEWQQFYWKWEVPHYFLIYTD